MTDSDEFQAYLQDSSPQPKRLFTEEPSSLPPPPIQKAPTGLAPMGRIELEGRAYRGLASGNQPWWVLIAGWTLAGLCCLVVLLSVGAVGGQFEMLGVIAFCSVLVWIMYRGTCAKLERQEEQRQQREKYLSRMRELD